MSVKRSAKWEMSLRASGLASMVALLLASSGCGQKKPTEPPPLSVVVTEVVQQDVPITQEWVGSLLGSVNAEIRPKVEGFVVKQLYAEGSVVKQGAPLFQIDPRSFKASLEQAKGSVARYEAALHLADITVERYTPLAKDNAVSQQELDDALSNQRQAQGNLQSAKAQLEEAQLNLAWCTVTSLIEGIAGTAEIQVGSLVNPASLLTTVSTIDPIRVTFGIAEQQYLKFAETRKQREADGLAADKADIQLVLADGTIDPHLGKLIILNRQVDVKTGTITIIAEFPNPDGLLRPGQYGKIRIVTNVKKGALLVPQAAVKELQGDDQVAVVGADGAVELRSVSTAERVGPLWVIDDGLKPGERVVVGGLQMVKSGMKVQAVAAPPAGAAAAEKEPAAGNPVAGAPAGGR
jgi:membrane fusion protein, multidrug efflux system